VVGVADAREERAEELVRLEVDGLRDGRFLATPATGDWPRVDMDPAASTWRPTCKCRLGADDASDPDFVPSHERRW
jgi:hypothetical protein